MRTYEVLDYQGKVIYTVEAKARQTAENIVDGHDAHHAVLHGYAPGYRLGKCIRKRRKVFGGEE